MRQGNNRRPDYEAISRRSIAKDFYPDRLYLGQKKVPEKRNLPEITLPKEAGRVYRVININPACEYARYARFIVGKLFRLVETKGVGDSTTGWYEFVNDEERAALNKAAGWSNNKDRYFFERPKLK